MNKTLGFLLLGGGGLWIAYEFGWLCGFGFGPSCAPAAAGGTAPAPSGPVPSTGPAAPPPTAPTTTPSAPAPGTVGFTLIGPVTPDINNSVKGQVQISGSTLTLNCIPPGTIYQGAADITAQLTSQGVDVSGLCSAMQAALTTQRQAAGSTTTTTGTSTTGPSAADLKAQIQTLSAQLASGAFPPNIQIAMQAQLQATILQLAKISQAPGMLGYGMAGPRRSLYSMGRTSPINYVRRRA